MYSASTPRAKLDPHEVDRLIVYAMGELERQGMSFVIGGELICVGTSRNQMVRLARDSLRIFGPQKARQTIDEHIANLVEVERDSYRAGFTRSKKKAPTDQGGGAPADQSEGEVNPKGPEND